MTASPSTATEPKSPEPDTALAPAPAGPHRVASGEVHVWCASLDVPAETLARLDSILAADERRRSARFRFPRDRCRFIVAHGVLRELLGLYLQTEPRRIGFVYQAFGKPDLGPAFGGRLKFNLSHSAGLALIAVAAGSDVGVDLESIRPRPDYPELARHFFSTSEIGALSAVSDDRYAEAFLGCWTKKEAYVKARGCGLTLPLQSFTVPVTTDPAQDPAILRATSSGVDPASRWSIHTLKPAPGFVGALAVQGSGWRLREWRI